MSVYRESKPLIESERFTVEDSFVLKKLLKTKKLTDRQKEALERLLSTYWDMMD